MARRRNPTTPPAADPPEAHAQAVSVTPAADGNTTDELLATIRALRAELAIKEEQRSEAEKAALAAAEAQGALMQRDIQEVPTGRKVKVRRQKVEHGRPVMKTVAYHNDGRPIFESVTEIVERPTYFYKIDMPPCGGLDMKINGESLYHGVVYEFDEDTLRGVKEQIFRLWDHDRNIHGSDENFYRTPQERVLRGVQGRGA